MVINSVLGLDVGEKRVGVARVNLIAKIPEPLATLSNDTDFNAKLAAIIQEHSPDAIVVGLPRNMSGEETAQSAYVRQFTNEHLMQYKLPVIFQDETLSSVEAENRLGAAAAQKGAVDAVAASVILEDYLQTL